MQIEQLFHRYSRLQSDLAQAYGERPWPSARIDALADEISQTERQIADLETGRGHAREH